MPIKIPNGLPAVNTLRSENISVMTQNDADTLQTKPVRVLLLNLMPTKIETETQLARVLGSSALHVELELLRTGSHVSKNTSPEHMLTFYKTFDQVRHRYYDGMIITGAPVEHLEFEEVEYWQELCEIMEWTKTHVRSTYHICWGAQAALYYHFGIQKHPLSEKLFGIFPHRAEEKEFPLFCGFDDVFMVPHSRHTTVLREDIEHEPELQVLASSPEAGVYAAYAKEHRYFFITGHSEYDPHTLMNEYLRDKNAGLPIAPPKNYFPDDDDTQPPTVTWRAHGRLIYGNWLKYFVCGEAHDAPEGDAK